MAEPETTKQEGTEETNGNGSNGGTGRTVAKAAAIAAVSGATALAAKKALGNHGSDEEKQERSPRKRGSDDVLGSMVSSAWESARDSVVPMMESAATSAGEYLARNGPDVVRETIVPKFIDGFERGRSSDDEED
jgi:hypothetical protein